MDAEEREHYRSLNTPYPKRMKPKWRIVLDALLEGQVVELDGRQFRCAMDDFENTEPYMIGQEMTIERSGNPPEKCFMILDPPISWLIREANKLCTEEVVAIAMNTTLKSMANENTRKREAYHRDRKRR